MMSCEDEIITQLLDTYERRKAYQKEASSVRSISVKVANLFKEYANAYNHDDYQAVNLAVENLLRQNLITAVKTNRGMYDKVSLQVDRVKEAYAFVHRKPIADQFAGLSAVLEAFHNNGSSALLERIVHDFDACIQNGKKLPYGINYDEKRLQNILTVIQAITALQNETYVRNFSNALFKDSKVFQAEFESTVQSILYEYTETAVEKSRILEVYNLYDNPTYVLLKGGAIISAAKTRICLSDLTGGIAIPEKALADITAIQVLSPNVITVENLTTFHDCTDSDNLYIYLGGFHNHSKEALLKMIYAQNPSCAYFHKGDLDVYGFAILESLKKRTGIPFKPLEMDLATLQRFYQAGLYKSLTEADKKAMKAENLQQYAEIFQFMLENNCKVEQESLKAIDLIPAQ